MGKSDPHVFRFYEGILEKNRVEANSIAFLGFSEENTFTNTIKGDTRHFYDLSLGNWEINSDWTLKQNYDLIVSTRCAYFSKDPDNFVKKCRKSLTETGVALIDWGLGDHWKFKNYKVGWVRNGEHEHAYKEGNFLHSCFWNDSMKNDPEIRKFWEHVVGSKIFGYTSEDSLDRVVRSEVPSIVSYETIDIKCLFLWPDSPQIYIATLVDKDES